jgi:hypothetical protein
MFCRESIEGGGERLPGAGKCKTNSTLGKTYHHGFVWEAGQRTAKNDGHMGHHVRASRTGNGRLKQGCRQLSDA